MTVRIVKLPDIGEGVAEAEVVEWQVAVGDLVAEDQVLAAVMTDKATVEIPAPCAGTILALGAAVGETLAVGGELVRLDVGGRVAEGRSPGEPAQGEVLGGERSAGGPPAAQEQRGPAGPGTEEDRAEALPETPDPAVSRPAPVPTPSRPAAPRAGARAAAGPPRPVGDKPLAAPSVRQRARDAGVDLRQVRGGGPAGRIRHEDLDAFLRGAPAVSSALAADAPNMGVEEIKVVGMRRRIARNMAESKRRVAHFSYVEEVDVTALEALRVSLNARHAARGRLTLLPFLMRAVVRAVAEVPQVNAHYDDDAEVIRRFGAAHIGIATQTDSGLTVPVVRHAEARDLWDLAGEVRRLAEAAREGRATAAELTGSTITISSLGALGGIMSTPVVNRPEVAVIGVNKQVVRPAWIDGAFAPRTMMNLSSSFDHRVVDGMDAATFIQRVRGLLEEPATLFI